jgi:shikimate dehydrogenase
MSSVPRITGATRLYAIIGDPVAQARSPEVYTARFAAAGIHAVMVPFHVPAAKFDQAAPALLSLANLDGILVTAPYKARMPAFASRLGPAAKAIGAINALRREVDGSWTGDIFDGAGFVRGAEAKGERLRDRRVSLFGAGGAGSAIAYALASAGVASLRVIDRTPARAEALVARLQPAFPRLRLEAAPAISPDSDMIVNATTVGMRPDDPLPAAIGPLPRDTLVGDAVISPSPTALIRHAVACGCAWIEGKDMHSGQIGAIMGFFGLVGCAAESSARDGSAPRHPASTAPGR